MSMKFCVPCITLILFQIISVRRTSCRSLTGAVSGVPPLSFCVQNCNSLNLSGLQGNVDSKLLAIVASKSDIILLSDTRVVSSQGISTTNKICDGLRDCKIRKYTAFFNSTSNSRGTAILVGSDLNFTITKEYRDPHENYYFIIIQSAA
jgi:hypothetical protein